MESIENETTEDQIEIMYKLIDDCAAKYFDKKPLFSSEESSPKGKFIHVRIKKFIR